MSPSQHLVPVHAPVRAEGPVDVGHDPGAHVALQPRQDVVPAVVVVDVKVFHAQQPVVLYPLRRGSRSVVNRSTDGA